MVGQIIVTGSKVFDFVEGDRVGAFLPRGGGNARYICLKADRLIPIPSDIDAAEAVTMMSIYLMAYQVLKMITLSGPTFTLHDKKVLIILGHGRTDPIGHALIQMCQKARAFILVTAPKSQHEYYKTVWNVVPLPVDSKEWIQMVQYRMDYVFDGLCEDGLKTPYRALKRKNPTCELVCYGCTSMLQQSESMGLLGAPLRAHFHRLRINLLSSMTSSSSNPVKRVQFVDIYDDNYLKDGMYKKHIRSLLQLLKLNKIKPKVIEKVPLSKVAEAQLLIEASWTPSVTENEESNIVGSSNDGNQKLKEIEESLKHHGIIVCLPWMKDKKSTKRGYDKGTNTSESDVHETGRPATPELVKDENSIEVCDKSDDATNNDKRNDKSEEDRANDGTVHPIEDYSRTLNEDTGIAIETIGGEATVVTDASSIQTQFWLMCLDV
jgi:NADPH:quinone reductase-like Zn-dependent oxidoreductase